MTDEPTARPSSEPVFRRGSLDDAEAMLRVIRAAFPEWPAFEIDVPPIEHLRWKMSQPEGLRRDMHAIVEIEGEVVATQVRWRNRVWVRGEEVPFEIGADMAVHPSAQGRGLSRFIRNHEQPRMYNERVIGFDTPARHERVLALQTDGDRISRPIPLWVRPFSARAFVGIHRADGDNAHLARALADEAVQRVRRVIARPRRRRAVEARRVTIARATHLDERPTELWKRVEPEYDLAMRRFADWLNWRYLDPRAGRIRLYTATEGDPGTGRLLGFAAFRATGREGRVLDLVTDRDAPPEVGVQLLERGAAFTRDAGCDRLLCMLAEDDHEARALRPAGFLPTGSALMINAAIRRHAVHVPEFNEIVLDPAARLHVTFGDFDHG
jgi:GNAT superfamily N-acetyltransferase